MGVVVIDRKFLYENKNGSDFSLFGSDTTSILKTNVTERVKEITTIHVAINAITIPSDSNQFELIDAGGIGKQTITRISGSFIVDGFLQGDVFDFLDIGGASTIITGGIIDSVTDLSLIVTSAGVAASFTDAEIHITQDLTELNFQYTTNGLGVTINIDSIIESVQQYKNNGVGIDPGGGRVTTFSTSTPRLPERWLTQETDAFKIKFLQNVDTYTQEFEYEHIFLQTHYWEESQQLNQDTLNSPNPFKNSTLQYRRIFDIGSAENTGNLRRFILADVGTDSVGWLNENFDGGENKYALSSVAYELVSDATPLDNIEVTESTKVFFVITDAGSTFLDTDPVTIFISLQPNASVYKNDVGRMKEIWLQQNVRTEINAAIIVGTGIIRNLDINLDNAGQISGSFETVYTSSQQGQITAGDPYLITVVVEDSSLTNNTTNKVTLKIDNNIYSKDSDIAGLVVFDEANYFDHTQDFVAGTFNGNTNFTLANEDIFLSAYRFHIVTATDEIITIVQMSALLVAFNTVTDSFFILDTFAFPIPRGSNVNTLGQLRHLISVDTEREFNVPVGDQFNQVVIDDDNFDGLNQFYNVSIGQRIPFDENQPLAGVDTVFFDSNEPNNGLNQKTSRYSGVNDYVIRAALSVVVNFRGGDTNYVHFSGNSTVNDYNESTFTAAFTTTDLLDVPLDGRLLQFENSKIIVLYDDGNVKADIAEFESITRLYKENESNIFELSSLRDGLTDVILKGETTPLLLDKAIVSDDFQTTGLSVGNLLEKTTYVISSRLFELLFDNTLSVFFDGIDDFIDCGNDVSLDLEFTNTFSFSCWAKFDNFSTRNTLLTKQRFAFTPRGYNFQVETSGKMRFSLANDGFGLNDVLLIESNTVLTTGVWFNLVVTYDGNALPGGVKFYVDNVLTTNTTISNTLTSTIIIPAINLNLGARAGSNNFQAGNLDEVAMWNRELTVGEVNEIWNAGCPANLDLHSRAINRISWWQMGEGATGSTIPDEVGVNDGTLTNGAVVVTDSKCP